MLLRAKQIFTITRVTINENIRKQVLQVVVILTIAAIASTSLLSFFEMGVQIKILKDLSLATILFSGGALAIALSCGSLPGELQSRTAYPYLARAIRRSDYLLAKFLGTVATCALCMVMLGMVFLALIANYTHQFDSAVAIGIIYIILQAAIIAAIGTFFSTFLSPLVSATMTFFIFLLGQVKVTYLHPAIDRASSAGSKVWLQGLYTIIPNLDSFSFKDALVHGITIPATYLVLVAVYGLLYTAFTMSLSGQIFARKEL